MRILIVMAAMVLSSAALAQSFDGSLTGSLGGGLSSGLGGGVSSGLNGSIGPTQQGRTRARIDGVEVGLGGGCAPGQVSLGAKGCRPVRELGLDSRSTYESSVAGMAPLGGLTLDGTTLDLGAGPAMGGD